MSSAETVSARNFLPDVIDHCERTIRMKPEFPDPYITLAKALTQQGKLGGALQNLETAIRLDPKSPDAHENLGEILMRNGDAARARDELRAALGLRPEWEPVMNNLAWLLATHPESRIRNGQEARRIAERACQLSGQTNLWFIHTLAAAYAETGDFTNAVTAAERALRLAGDSGRSDLISNAQFRVELYESHQPLREQ